MSPCKTTTPLQRGSACLCCRKRKLKCDGTKPVCRQCTKMNRADECEYDDKRQKSRTQKLKEKLSSLEERLRELESDPIASTSNFTSFCPMPTFAPSPESSISSSSSEPALLLTPTEIPRFETSSLASFDILPSAYSPIVGPTLPSIASSSRSSSSPVYPPFYLGDTSGNDSLNMVNPLFNVEDCDSGHPVHNFFEMSPFTGLSASTYPYMLQWDPKDPLPSENKKILLDIFLAHRHQCWFDGDISRFDSSLTQDHNHEPHPALMNAIYLLACLFARSPSCSELEPIFFTRALHEINVALDTSDRLVDIVQASGLLAVYLYSNCRPLEGYCHSFSAARLAVGLGLHQIHPPESLGLDSCSDESALFVYPSPITPIPIPAPRDHKELMNRISAFWQVFMVDRCWSVANGLPVALPDSDSSQIQIKTPWPSSVTDPAFDDRVGGCTSTIGSLFELQPLDLSMFAPALRAKAAALYERTFRLTSVSQKDDAFWGEYRSAELAVKRFSISLPPFVGYEAWRSQSPLVDVDLFAIHTMVHVSIVHLHRDIPDQETFEAANSILSLIRQLNDGDYEYLDPILSACWSYTAKMYIHKLGKAQGTMPYTVQVNVIEQELDVLINAMKTLSAFFPLAGDHARKIEQERAQMLGGMTCAH